MEKKLEFTERAENQIEKITKSEAKKYFRIAVKGGGCSGYKYNFSFDDKIEKNDILFNKTIIDKQSLNIIAGSIVDYKKEMIGETFDIIILKLLLLVVVVYLFQFDENYILECKFCKSKN